MNSSDEPMEETSLRVRASTGRWLATLLAMLPVFSRAAPLIIREQGSFFVGGEHKALTHPALGDVAAQAGEITVNQMYVQYQIPPRGGRHVPVVMVHGCCLSSKSWETTPDGRMGWNEYFLRKDRAVYLADQVSRARSGFDPTPWIDASAGKTPASQPPFIIGVTHQLAWKVFRFGPEFGQVFPDQQFPMEAVEELYKQMIPDLNRMLPQDRNPTWLQMAALGAKLHGAILMGHSESGFFPERAALVDSAGVRGIVSIESECESGLTPAQIKTLAVIPTLFVFGDHLADVAIQTKTGTITWAESFAGCNALIDALKAVGADAEMMHLPALGIGGNSHMLMQDRNNLQVADLILAWIDRHVETRQGRARIGAR